ncbi:hypothetical protein CHLNCDRAFT_138633 [Chlorella variabilis]|uniref:Granulins domain-containing protein n=1 Tax=Chlorella variabilis TaxID=554065 RepID=E1ZNF6_CHLVA|nr:hypothetical protein CHLNCDRAFT_138633 [Chlorella variabilis]EFN52672.1 hypothetical protein CHLNCDRAFT_138633 [Chlorella variabilis]|eukprot:XP_005844774.1 hypothetical protein CHLNCDRAFT_138633 [Chlorella variabilis]
MARVRRLLSLASLALVLCHAPTPAAARRGLRQQTKGGAGGPACGGSRQACCCDIRDVENEGDRSCCPSKDLFCHDYQAYLSGASTPNATSLGTCSRLDTEQCGKPGGPCSEVSRCPTSSTCVSGFYCAGSLDPGEEYPSCRPVPPACGQLGSKCCPPEERPADLPGANSGTGAFCYAADVVCSAPMGSVEASECIKLPSADTCGQPGKECCPSFYRTSVDKEVPPICAKGAYCADGNKCNPSDCGMLGKPCCIVSSPSSTSLWCREPGAKCTGQDSWPGKCAACSKPPTQDEEWECTHPLAKDFSEPSV